MRNSMFAYCLATVFMAYCDNFVHVQIHAYILNVNYELRFHFRMRFMFTLNCLLHIVYCITITGLRKGFCKVTQIEIISQTD